MNRLFWILFIASPVLAHVMSMSTGDISVEGDRAHYELRMPIYEIPHVSTPDRSLFEHIRFSTSGKDARLVEKSCREDMSQGVYRCTAEYQFPLPVGRLDVECTFHSVTVPNHVHLLRAQKEGKRDQAIFDFSFQKATIRFDPPTAVETAVTQIGAGIVRAVGGLVQILFLASLALAARSRRELLALTGMFLAGQVATAILAPVLRWQPPARFVEAAAALTIAYLAVEILILPTAGQRWLIVGVLGIFHGLYFDLFLRASGYRPGYVLAGAAVMEFFTVLLFGFLWTRVGRIAVALKPVQVSACALLGIGMVWFFLRLSG